MRSDILPTKTDAGRDEILQRSRRLPNTLRSILLLVDGHRSVADLSEVAAGLRAPDDALEQLFALGLIQGPVQPEPVPSTTTAVIPPEAAARYSALYAFMSEAVREYLSLRGYFLQLKIERCGTTQELLALLPEMTAALAKARSMTVAGDFEQRVREMVQAQPETA